MATNATLQSLIDKNVQITFSNQLIAQTSEYLKGLTTSTLKLTGNLLPDEKAFVEDLFPCPVMWKSPKAPEIRPHAVLAVVRDGMRTIFSGLLARSKNLKTCYIGSTYREIRNLADQPLSHFSIYGTEPKDGNRVFTGMQDRIGHLFNEVKSKYPEFDADDFEFACTEEELVELYADVEGLRDRIGWRKERSGESFARLVYEDSHYNKVKEDYYMDFKSTGANVGYVLGLLPPELLEEKGPQNPLYTVARNGDLARMCDVRGYANGYIHDWSAWRTLMQYPAYNGVDFNLVFEMVSRVGPFAIIEISRTRNAGPVTRDLTLYTQPYVKIVNLGYYADKPKTMAELALKRVVDFDQFFVMAKSEYDSVCDYVSALPEASINMTAVVSFIRKRSGGAALIDKVFTRKWDLESQHYGLLAAVIILRVLRDREMLDASVSTLTHEGCFKRLWRRILTFHVPEWFVNLCFTSDIMQNAVRLFDPVISQTVELTDKTKRGPATYTISAGKSRKDPMSPGVEQKCRMCEMMPWLHKSSKDDVQTMICGKDIQSQHFEMTDAEVEAFRNTMLPDDEDAPELARVKLAAREKLPRTGFTTTTEVGVLLGAFGTGKSTQINKLVTSEDVVMAPFRKLMEDYTTDSNGDKIFFKTMHRGISDYRKCRYMFVDEAGSLPAEYLKIYAYLYQPEVIFLCGDFKQTKTTASEGTCVDKVVDVRNAHYLLYNFRNPVSVVSWAKKTQGYHLECAPGTNPKTGDPFNSDEPAFVFKDDSWEVPNGMQHISPDRALVNLGVTDFTIRQFQGQTEQELCISLTPESLSTFSVSCIKLVGLTRCRGSTYIRLCEGVSEDAVTALINRVEDKVYVPKAPREDVKVRDGRFMNAILHFMSKRQQALILDRMCDDVKADIRRESQVEAEETARQLRVSEYAGLESWRREQKLAIEDEDLAHEEERLFAIGDDDSDEEESSEATERYTDGGDQLADLFAELQDQLGIPFDADSIIESLATYDTAAETLPLNWGGASRSSTEYVSAVDTQTSVVEEDPDSVAARNEINAMAAKFNEDFWSGVTHTDQDRWEEVDREFAGTRTKDPLMIKFMTENARPKPRVASRYMMEVPSTSFAIGDDDDWNADTSIYSDDEDGEEPTVLQFL